MKRKYLKYRDFPHPNVAVYMVGADGMSEAPASVKEAIVPERAAVEVFDTRQYGSIENGKAMLTSLDDMLVHQDKAERLRDVIHEVMLHTKQEFDGKFKPCEYYVIWQMRYYRVSQGVYAQVQHEQKKQEQARRRREHNAAQVALFA